LIFFSKEQKMQNLFFIFANDRKRIENSDHSAAAVLTIHTYLQQSPISNTVSIRKKTGLSQPTVMRSLTALENLGIVKEITGKERHKIFLYRDYLDILNRGTEPLRY